MQLVFYPDPILRRRAAPLQSVDAEVQARAKEMFRIMYDERGVGLAAPQVGWSVRLFVMNPAGAEEPERERVLINPVILEREGSVTDEEGCLSIPDVRGRVERASRIVVESQDLDGNRKQEVFEDFEARIIQHEFDHLEGILFISRLSEAERLASRRNLKKLEKDYAKRQQAKSSR